jgi:1-acyl-sn-glycerol-3-phosphate acyltransferase
MNGLRKVFWVLYRVWFYILVALPILVLLPVLLISISREQWYPFFFKLARFWARFILIGMGFRYSVVADQLPEQGKSYMFIANHTSMADIMLMLSVVKNPFVFVGKKELARIPLFGFFYRKTCILVDRGDAKSRHAVFSEAQKRLKNGLSICIFPEGGVPDEAVVLDSFKDGAFRLAIQHQIPVVPLSFLDNKKRFSYTFFSGGPGRMRVLISPFIETTQLSLNDTKTLRETARNIILENLLKQE